MESGSLLTVCTAKNTARRFQVYLRKYENDEQLVVLEAVNKPMSELIDHHTSSIIKTTVSGTRGDGSPYTKSFTWKRMVETCVSSIYLDMSFLGQNEAHMYGKVLPHCWPYSPACIYQDEQNIIMEDLSKMGYVNNFTREYADLNHTVITLKTLAKFHASSLALKISDPRRFDEIATPLQEAFYKMYEINEPYSLKNMSFTYMNWTCEYIKMMQPQTQALQTMANILADLSKNDCFDKLRQLLNGPKRKYDSICHGDMWLNNLLFLYDDNNKLVDVKFIDYQLSRYTSIITDIFFFIYSSVQSSLINNSYESLIKIYHSALLKELRRLRVSEQVLAELGEKWLEKNMKEFAFYGLITGCWIVHPYLAKDGDIRQLLKSLNLDLPYSEKRPEKIDRLYCIVMHYYNRFHLGVRKDLEPLSVTE